MALWNKTDDANSAPKFVVNAGTGAIGNTAYNNANSNPTLFAVDVTETQVARKTGKGGVSPGWVSVTTVGSRKRYETLVALKVTGGDNAANNTLDDATFPDA